MKKDPDYQQAAYEREVAQVKAEVAILENVLDLPYSNLPTDTDQDVARLFRRLLNLRKVSAQRIDPNDGADNHLPVTLK